MYPVSKGVGVVDKGVFIPLIVGCVPEHSNSDSKESHAILSDGLSGPALSKPKSTWTRCMRMDFVRGGIIKATDVLLLGQRVCTIHTNHSNPCEEEEAHKVKQEKVNPIYEDVLARVDFHPC